MKQRNGVLVFTLLVLLSFSVSGMMSSTITTEARTNLEYQEVFTPTIFTDTGPPSIISPGDQVIEAQYDNITLEWNVTDQAPNQYIIYENGSNVDQGSWDGIVNITYNVGFQDPCIINYTLWVNDVYEKESLDTVLIEVEDTTAPSFSLVDDIALEYGDDDLFYWNITEKYPDSYVLFINEEFAFGGSFSSSVNVSLDGLALGIYNYTVIVIDDYDNVAFDTVMVYVDDTTDPVISVVDDLVAEGGTATSFTWTIQDMNLLLYQVFREDSIWLQNDSSFTLTPDPIDVVINLSTWAVGEYNVTIIAYDYIGNFANASVIVTIEDTTTPIIDSPTDLAISEDSTDSTIEWTCSDFDPSWIVIERNGSEVLSEAWDGESVVFSLEGLAPGVYNFTAIITDGSGHQVVDTVIVTISESTSAAIPLDEGTLLTLSIGLTASIGIVLLVLYFTKFKSS